MAHQQTVSERANPTNSTTDPVAVYDQVTRAWELLLGEDLHFGLFENQQDALSAATARLTSHMTELAQLHVDARLLDVGCGIGGPACYLAREHGCRVTGISTSHVGVQIAASRAAAQGLSARTQFFVRDAMANELDAESFDCVWVMESSHLMGKKDLLLAECARVLRPGGTLILCDVMLRRVIPFQTLVRSLAEFENLNKVFGKQYVELLAVYSQLAEEKGLTVMSTEDISEAVLPTLDHWASNAERHREEVCALVGEEYVAGFTRACTFLRQLWMERLLGYGILLAQKDG